MPKPETKHITTRATVTEEGDGQGLIRAVFSTFGNIDSTGDVVVKSAFTDGQEVPMVWSHNWDMPIGKGVVKVTPKQAIFEGQLWLDTEDGLQAFRKIKNAGSLQEFSWGFQVTDAEPGVVDGQDVRLIKGAELFEVSPVLVGANRQTHLLSIKTAEVVDAPEPEPATEPEPDDAPDDPEVKSVWSTSFVNNLPDSAFAAILDGGEKDADGKTTPRSLRKLPHHDGGGSVDMAHLRNALSREPQTDMPESMHAKAHAHLMRHASAEGMDTGKQYTDLLDSLIAEFERMPPVDDDEREKVAALAQRLTRAQGALTALLKRTDPIAAIEPRNQYRRFQQLTAQHGLSTAPRGGD